MIENSATCMFCGAAAEHVYELAKRAVDICTPCLARQELQDIYEQKLPELFKLAAAERFDEAHGVLDELRSLHGHRDRDGWLARSILAHKALLYDSQGEHGRAVAAYHEWARLGFAQPSERVEHSLGLSRALVADHRAQEAVAVLEATLESLDPHLLPDGISLLEALALSCAALNAPLPERWRGVLVSSAQAAGVELPKEGQDIPLDKLIYQAAEAMRAR